MLGFGVGVLSFGSTLCKPLIQSFPDFGIGGFKVWIWAGISFEHSACPKKP